MIRDSLLLKIFIPNINYILFLCEPLHRYKKENKIRKKYVVWDGACNENFLNKKVCKHRDIDEPIQNVFELYILNLTFTAIYCVDF